MKFTNLDPLTLDQTLCVRQYPEDNVFYRTLLLKDHPRQIEEYLVSLDFQLRLFVQVCVSKTNTAELEIASEDLFILLCKGSIPHLVDDLKTTRT